MIQSITLKCFRNFSKKEIFFSKDLNFIYGENGFGKSNCIDACCLLLGSELFWIDFDSLVQKGQEVFFIELKDIKGNIYALSYNRSEKKKKIFFNGKITTKQKLLTESPAYVVFHPFLLNLMYLSPTLRREYLDDIITKVFPSYESLQKRYKLILRNRNKLLVAISEWKGKREEIDFWNSQFIEAASKIYDFRYHLIDFLRNHIGEFINFFQGKVQEIEFVYKTKVDEREREVSMKNYLEKNFERDIILWVTHIGPHVDDFDILLDGVSLTSFASRGETKSLILWLKILETRYIEENTSKKPVLFIDDFLSEIDDTHKKVVLDTFASYQTIITSISPIVTERETNGIFL